ncbi:hypothetical protein TRICI_002635 [Trichomonascus ciferrii]|uniref:SYO1-like TPR repeats domain-containing protein n=1 Tax=Trichomonascus ciferrii TaxID=44093 RepID=A0A642V5J0_9ASCO|nr:hypothetical protein TRICI_002635 [Trichomonascus ciferrii]
MGKAKKPRNKKARKAANPISRESELRNEDVEAHKKTIIPLIEKLCSGKSDDRSMAISAITALSEDEKMRKVMLKEKLVHTVMKQSLSDESEEVVSEAYGLLRNLVVEEGYDIAVFLNRQDILTPIEAKLVKLKEVIDANDWEKMEAPMRRLVLNQLENLVGLLSSMAITHNDVFDGIDKRLPNLAVFLIQLIRLNDPALLTAACELLYVLSEDNDRVIDQISDYPFKELLKQEISNSARIYVNGILFNAYVEQGTADQEVLCEILKSIVFSISDVDLEKAKQNVVPKIENDTHVDVHEVNAVSAEARSVIDTVQMALELFTAIAEVISVDPKAISREPEEDEEGMMEEDDDEQPDMSDDAFIERSVEQEEDHAVEVDGDISFDGNEDGDLPSPSVEYLHEVVLPLIIRYLDEPLFVSRAMAALNNSCWTLSDKLSVDKNASWRKNAIDLWSNIFKYLESTDLEVCVGTIGALWAIATAFKGQVPIANEQISHITNKCSTVKQNMTNGNKDESTEYIVRATGLIGTVGMAQDRVEITRESSKFILSIISNALDCPIEVVIQALDTLFDMFGDGSYDYDQPVFIGDNILQTLKTALPTVRQAVKRVDKKRLPELRDRADEAALNLGRFIDYKKKERV